MRSDRRGQPSASEESKPVPAGIKVFVLVWLAVFLGAAAADIEAWPLTGWRLFSASRTSHSVGWEVVAVTETGDERAIAFSQLPQGYSRPDHIVRTFPRLSAGERDEVCDAWLDALAERGDPARLIRVYTRRAEIDLASKRPPRVVEREPRWECGGQA